MYLRGRALLWLTDIRLIVMERETSSTLPPCDGGECSSHFACP